MPGGQFDEEEAFDIGVVANAAEDSSGEFYRQASFRAGARRAFAEHDVGGRTARAMLRKAAPLAGQRPVGDVFVSAKGRQKATRSRAEYGVTERKV